MDIYRGKKRWRQTGREIDEKKAIETCGERDIKSKRERKREKYIYIYIYREREREE